MKLHDSFDVPLSVQDAWEVLLDIERIAPCLPGATITEIVDDRNYKGRVAVRLGPVALSFNGRASFAEVDEIGHRARVKAQGTDDKGRGGAVADVTFRLDAIKGGSRVNIETDLNLSGSIAQYGRGVGIIQATSEQLVGEFADNLRRHLAEDEGAAPGAANAPIAGFHLMVKALWAWLKALFAGGRRTGTGKPT